MEAKKEVVKRETRTMTVELPSEQLDTLKIESIRRKITLKELIHTILTDWQLDQIGK